MKHPPWDKACDSGRSERTPVARGEIVPSDRSSLRNHAAEDIQSEFPLVTESAHYTVLARRFRPQSFDEVVGQGHVGQAIRNAIRSNRVAHAYLFTGARGVGKTSTARIFAKALNCPHVQDGVPCNECDVCESIGAGSDVDVLEIDGASNRGIDDIRQLRANVNVRSMRSPTKVYIIDEVHMLTKEAFNALLKTLEEPPANVKFVFCTTEPNKVPDTILSRCQRFDFGTIAQGSIVARLEQIAQSEGRTVEAQALELVARRAAGSMRDSQSLFDQLLAFGSEQITAEDVHQLLGTASDDRLIQFVDVLIARNGADALQMLESASLEGVQIGSFSDQLLAYFRDLLVTAAGAITVPLTGVSDSNREKLRSQADIWGIQRVTAAMQILADTKGRMQRVNYARALMELAIVRISQLEDLNQIADLLEEVRSGSPASVPDRAASPVKKNVEGPQLSEPTGTVTDQREIVSDSPGVPEPTALKQIPLTAETASKFLLQIIFNSPDTLKSHLKNASRTAIFGPNSLEIVFPKSYLFSKTYCERPETAQRLTELATQIAGTEVQCRISVDELAVDPPPPPKRPQQDLPARRSPATVEKDDFVQQAVSIFQGQVVDVRPVLSEIGSETSN